MLVRIRLNQPAFPASSVSCVRPLQKLRRAFQEKSFSLTKSFPVIIRAGRCRSIFDLAQIGLLQQLERLQVVALDDRFCVVSKSTALFAHRGGRVLGNRGIAGNSAPSRLPGQFSIAFLRPSTMLSESSCPQLVKNPRAGQSCHLAARLGPTSGNQPRRSWRGCHWVRSGL